MLRVALRGVRAHLVRFLLSTLAVMLGVAFVVGTFTFRAMLSSTFDEIIATTLVADVYVRGAEEIDDSTTAGSTFGTPHSPVPVSLADTVAGSTASHGPCPTRRVRSSWSRRTARPSRRRVRRASGSRWAPTSRP